MTKRRPSAGKAVREVIHDSRGHLSTLVVAITTLQDEGDDPHFREKLLDNSLLAARRLSADLIGISALVVGLTDKSPLRSVALEEKIKESELLAQRSGVRVKVEVEGLHSVLSRPDSLDRVLAALMSLTAVGDAELTVQVSNDSEGVIVEFVRRDGTPIPSSRIIGHLIRAAGATPSQRESGLAFSFQEAGE